MKNVLAFLNSSSQSKADSLRSSALSELQAMFSDEVWGIELATELYTSDNYGNLWKNELPTGVKRALESSGLDEAAYGSWLGEVHYQSIAIYLKALFPDYRKNAGWRISLVSIPRAGASAAGIASHYQNAQNHNALGRASNLLYQAAKSALEVAEPPLALPGRAVGQTDWDSASLMVSTLSNIGGHSISAAYPQGLGVKGIRTTTVKKILASFINVVPHFSMLSEADAKARLDEIRITALYLSRNTYPFATLEDFEAFRSIAISDLNAAGIRLRLKSGAATNAVVRVYYGPPGTGKTLTAVSESVRLVEPSFSGDYRDAFVRFNELHSNCCFLTFHPSLQYQDLVESIRPSLSSMNGEIQSGAPPDGEDAQLGDEINIVGAAQGGQGLSYSLFEGPLLRMVRRAQGDPRGNYVVVIDEINRGDISRVLGPLISCLEPDKRAGAQFPIGYELQYASEKEQDGRLYLPSNLHILGTMNSTDRNIALVDYALRRRFEFIEVPPLPSVLGPTKDLNPIDCARLLTVLNQRIARLLDSSHCLGHGFFVGCKTNSEVIACLVKKVIPQLKEYFFGNEGLLLLIFGEAKAIPNGIFLQEGPEESFETTFGVSADVASRLGHRTDAVGRAKLRLSPKFWSDQAIPPGPDDLDYAAAAVRRVYDAAATVTLPSTGPV